MKKFVMFALIALLMSIGVSAFTPVAATVNAVSPPYKVHLFVCEPYSEDCSVSGGYWVINDDEAYGPVDCSPYEAGADDGTAQCSTGYPPLESVGWVNQSPVALLDGSPVYILDGYGPPHKPLVMTD